VITRFKRGNLAESLVISYLTRLGYSFVDRNVYTPFGEIDIVMAKSSIHYFIEVKSSFTQFEANPWMRIHDEKLDHLYDSVNWWSDQNMLDENIEVVYVFVQIASSSVILTIHNGL
jgi:putative endonuclease